MRLGGPVFGDIADPDAWVAAVRDSGYRAAYCPVAPDADDATVAAYEDAARKADIVIAEVGAWSNPISPDPHVAHEAKRKCIDSLALAERIGARCCVNIAGSRGSKWDGPSREDLTEETFDVIVRTVREIIDAVKPTRTFYTLETMPWMYPNSPESYARLIDAIDRPGFAVHFDAVNLINDPQKYFENAALIERFVQVLGPKIRSCHAKDIRLEDRLTVHLDEIRPGLGGVDYAAFLRAVDSLGADTPLMLEHLPSEDEYCAAAAYVRDVASAESIDL